MITADAYKNIPDRDKPGTTTKKSHIAFGLDKLEQGVTGREVYYCTKCNQRVSFDTNSQPPRVCKRCGEEFDWGSLDKRKVKVCPTCNKEYDLDDVYCEDHTPAVKLQEELH